MFLVEFLIRLPFLLLHCSETLKKKFIITEAMAYNDSQSETTQLRKLFVGGLSANISDAELREHFSKYGELADVVVMKDRGTGRPRGFGFVTYSDESGVDAAQAARPHILDGREVETKRAMPRTEAPRDVNNTRADKMFLGGLGPETTEEHLREYFSQFGEVQSVEIVITRETGKPRGFGFVTYRDPDSVDKAILHKPHTITGSQRVDCKKAVSREQMAIIRSRNQGSSGYGGGYGGSYGGGYGGGGYGYGDGYGNGGGYDGYGGYHQNGDGFGSYGGQGYGGGPSKPGGGFGGGPQRFQPYGGGPVGGPGRGGYPSGVYRGGRGGRDGY